MENKKFLHLYGHEKHNKFKNILLFCKIYLNKYSQRNIIIVPYCYRQRGLFSILKFLRSCAFKEIEYNEALFSILLLFM